MTMMRLMLWVGDEGPTDLDLKDGDIFSTHDAAWTPGTQELLKRCIIEVEAYGGSWEELVQPEYAVGESPESPVVRHARKYCVNYWEILTPDEIIAVRDQTVSVPIFTGRFSLNNIRRK